MSVSKIKQRLETHTHQLQVCIIRKEGVKGGEVRRGKNEGKVCVEREKKSKREREGGLEVTFLYWIRRDPMDWIKVGVFI